MPVTLEDFAADVAASTGTPQATTTPALATSPRGISFEDFAADVGAATGVPTQGSSTTPLTNNAFSLAQEDARLKRKTRLADGIPVGEESDLAMPFLENLAAGVNISAEGEVATWRKFYKPENVFVDSDGDIFIRQTTDKGLKQMVPVNEAGPSMADAARLVLALKDMYLSIKGGKMGQRPATPGTPATAGGQLRNLGQQVGGGVAGSVVGQGGFALAGDDTLSGAATGLAINAGIEGTFGLGLGGGGQLTRNVVEWWRTSGAPAGKRAIAQLRAGVSGTTADESIMREALGDDLIETAAARGVAAQEATATAAAGVNVAARRDVGDAISRGTGTPASMTRLDLGTVLSARPVEARDAWKAADGAIFEAVRADPRASAFVLDPQGVVDEARTMVRGMTSVQRTGVEGEVVTETVADLNVSGVLGKLKAVTSLEGGKVRLTDLMTARTAIGEAVAMGEAVPGTHTGAMKDLYKNLTTAIEQGFKDLNAPDLQKKWKGATESYAKAAAFFEQPAFKRVFKEGDQTVSPEEVVASLTDSTKAGDTYRTFKQLLRPAEMTQVKRAVADNLTDLSLDPSTLDIGAKQLGEKVRAFAQANPEMAQDVFGAELPAILATLDAATEAGGRVSVQGVADAFSSAGLFTARSLNQLLAAQTHEAQVFRNAIVKQAVAGTLDPTTITPSKFVSSLLDAKPSDLREVMKDVTDPVTLRGWRQATTTDILDSVMDARTGAINRDTLLKQLGTPMSDRAQNLRLVLGTDAEATLRKITSDAGFRSHISKFMVKVLPSAVGAGFVKFKYRYLASKALGAVLSDDQAVKWMTHYSGTGGNPPRLLETHIATLVREALNVPGQMPADEMTPPTQTSPQP